MYVINSKIIKVLHHHLIVLPFKLYLYHFCLTPLTDASFSFISSRSLLNLILRASLICGFLFRSQTNV